MQHTVVISDVHLCEAEPSDGLWMKYRQRRFSPGIEIAAMLDALRREVHGEELAVVLNGDIFDLDAPRVVEKESVFHDLPRTAEFAVPAMAAILDDHPEFVQALGRVLAEGHEIVLVSGNHDVQLALPEVRALVASRLADAALAVRAAESAGGVARTPTHAEKAALTARVLFRAWFHKTNDGIVIEHGNQYDTYCSYRYPMAPFGRKRREIQPTMGSLATRLLASRMGYFNPHVDSSFMLTVFGYVKHWAKYYLFSRRSLAFAWATGAVRTFFELVLRRDPENRKRRRANIKAAARETGAPVRVVARHARMFSRPAEDRLDLVMRELWLDRVLLAALCIGLAAAWIVASPFPLSLGAALGPLVLVAYEALVPKLSLEFGWRHVQRVARKVGKVHKARAVVFGHTHHPEGAWERSVFFGNTGSWSAAFRDVECTQPVFNERPLVWLSSTLSGEMRGGLYAWKDGRFEPRVVTPSTPRPETASPTPAPWGVVAYEAEARADTRR